VPKADISPAVALAGFAALIRPSFMHQYARADGGDVLRMQEAPKVR